MPTLNRQTIKRYERVPKPELSTRPEELYNLKIWKSLRNWKITNYPLCEVCLEHGRSEAATDIHHKIPYQRGRDDDERYRLFSDANNLMSVCNRCHQALHKKAKQQYTAILDYLNDREYGEAHGVICNDYK